MELKLFVALGGTGKQISAGRLSVEQRENFGRDPTDAE